MLRLIHPSRRHGTPASVTLLLVAMTGRRRAVLLMQLARAVGTIKFMAFTGNRNGGNHKQQEAENFHRAPSIAARRQNATPNPSPSDASAVTKIESSSPADPFDPESPALRDKRQTELKFHPVPGRVVDHQLPAMCPHQSIQGSYLCVPILVLPLLFLQRRNKFAKPRCARHLSMTKVFVFRLLSIYLQP